MGKVKYTKEVLEPVIKSSRTFKEVCKKFGVTTRPSMQSRFSILCRQYRIDYSHFNFFTGDYYDRKVPLGQKQDILELLTEGSDNIAGLLGRLVAAGFKDRRCEHCGLTEWLGNPPTLDIDHVNDNHRDNRLENLQVLCCNCHRVKTLKSRSERSLLRRQRLCRCIMCGASTHKPTVTRCRLCYASVIISLRSSTRKFNPSKAELAGMVWQMPSTKVAKYYGVSDSAVVKRCKLLGISKPPRGYWAKKQNTLSLSKQREHEGSSPSIPTNFL